MIPRWTPESRPDLLREVPQQQRAIRVVEDILETAGAILIDPDLEFSFSEIGRLSKSSKGTVYRYFEDVDSILMTLAVPYAEAAVHRVHERMSAVDTAADVAIGLSDLLRSILKTCRRDPLAHALMIGSTRQANLGKLYNETIWRITDVANIGVAQFIPVDPLSGPQRRRVALGFHFVRSLIELADDLSDEESKMLYMEFGEMMYLAANHDINYPTPVVADPYAGGLLPADPPK